MIKAAFFALHIKIICSNKIIKLLFICKSECHQAYCLKTSKLAVVPRAFLWHNLFAVIPAMKVTYINIYNYEPK